jgi:hypothetical protein
MKAVSKFAIALALGSLSMTASTAAWAADEKPKKEDKKKKGKEAEAPAQLKLAMSKEFTAVYQPVINAYIKAKDAATASASWDAIKAAIKNEDDRYQAGVFGMQIGRETKNAAMQSESVELVLASTTTPADQRTAYTFQKAATAYDTKDWANAEIWLIKAYEAGYRSNSIRGGIEMLVADALNFQKKYPESLAWMERSLVASAQPGAAALPDSFYPRGANVALKIKDRALIARWMTALVRSNPTPDYWHDALMQTYAAGGLDTQEELDLMRLLRSVGGMKYEQNYSAYATDALIFPDRDEGSAGRRFRQRNNQRQERHLWWSLW